MEVNFNNMRKQAVYAMDDLIKRLNESINRDDEYATVNGRHQTVKDHVVVDVEDIQKSVDELRSLIMTMTCIYEPGDDNFKNLYDEVIANGGCARFNDEILDDSQEK